MSSFKNAIPRRAHKERAQPKLMPSNRGRSLDFLRNTRIMSFVQKGITRKMRHYGLRDKADSRNPDEFYFKMIKTKTVYGVHKPESMANKYTHGELMLMKNQDIGFILQKLQSKKKKIEKLIAVLHSLDVQPSNRHFFG